MYKSIYRRIFLRLEIDLYKGVRKGYYGTQISSTRTVHRSVYGRMLLWLEMDLYVPCTVRVLLNFK